MPDIGHVAGEQRPNLAPVRPVIVQHLAGAFGLGRARLVTPRGIVFNTVGWIGRNLPVATACPRLG